MDETYLIEIRPSRTRWRLKETISRVANEFNIQDFRELHPHVTLFGPLTLKPDVTEQRVLDEIARIATNYDPVPFLIGPFEKRDGMHGGVLAFSLIPSEAMRTLTREISNAISPLVQSQNVWDAEPEWKWFHITIANRLDRKIADEVIRDLTQPHRSGLWEKITRFILGHRYERKSSIRPLVLDENGLRITVMKGDEIFAEYDFLTKQWIIGEDIHDTHVWCKSLLQFRRYTGFEVTEPPENQSGPFLIADLHLGHANIIRYCNRPFCFSHPEEMDAVLIANWNATVRSKDSVIYAGDLRYGKNAAQAHDYLQQLNGVVTFIRGNHDEEIPGSLNSLLIRQEGIPFMIVHDPADVPENFDGWIIHGHHHNNDLTSYPFINFQKRRVNVSAEVLGYVPVPLSEITARIRKGLSEKNPQPVLLRYPYLWENSS